MIRFLLLVTVWLFIWFHIPLSGGGRWNVEMIWRLARAAAILASMLAILYLEI